MEINTRENSITLHTSNVIVFFTVSFTKIVKHGKNRNRYKLT
ncbi:unknown [Clostridium sp. CAG:921]|nr:unknown [Clostridium sp. CAG:921]